MASSGLDGPFDLTATSVDGHVANASPGAYALGEARDGTFYISYVGRSDTNLNMRLKDHSTFSNYQHFKYACLPSAKAAFDKECDLFHDFSPIDNKVHPARSNSSWKCPRCPVFG